MVRKIKTFVKMAIASAPLIMAFTVISGLCWLVWKIVGREGMPILFWIFGSFIGLGIALRPVTAAEK